MVVVAGDLWTWMAWPATEVKTRGSLAILRGSLQATGCRPFGTLALAGRLCQGLAPSQSDE